MQWSTSKTILGIHKAVHGHDFVALFQARPRNDLCLCLSCKGAWHHKLIALSGVTSLVWVWAKRRGPPALAVHFSTNGDPLWDWEIISATKRGVRKFILRKDVDQNHEDGVCRPEFQEKISGMEEVYCSSVTLLESWIGNLILIVDWISKTGIIRKRPPLWLTRLIWILIHQLWSKKPVFGGQTK
jgi:hypothetical protein